VGRTAQPLAASASTGNIAAVLRSLRIHGAIYALFVVFFVLIWAFTGAGYFWPIWPTLGWGVAVGVHWIVALNAHPRDRRTRDGIPRAVQAGAERAPAEELRPTQTRSRIATVGGAPSRRWVTVMFTDIANSTSLTEALGDEEWSRFLALHRTTLRAAFHDRHGSEVGSQGDGLLARFSSPADAVLCAVDIQRKMDELRESGGLVPRLRIGIHAGEAVEGEGDIVGRVVNLAARVTAEAAPGEILVTEPVADEMSGRIELQDRGLRPLKGVQQPRHLLAVLWSA
jgi:class 3 adenylate cyclase